MESKELPEARASVTFNVTSPKGFGLLLTVRSTDEKELFAQLEKIETYLIEKGYKTGSSNGNKPKDKEYVEGKCPLCGSGLVKFTTKTGKTGIQCDTRKYDFQKQTTVGCAYIKWD